MTTTPGKASPATAWRRYALAFVLLFFCPLGLAYLFILLIDPFGTSAVALPLNRAPVTVQRYMYPQLIRSGQFDSVIVGTSTSMLLDPDILNGPFKARFANIAMASATAWEQKTLIELFLRTVKHPKAVVIGVDVVWCQPDAAKNRITSRGFPDWLYDDNRWNDYLHLLNRIGFMSAVRLLRFNLGLYTPTTRADGMDTFLPPDNEYDLERARQHIYGGRPREIAPDNPTPPLSARDGQPPEFTALPWLDQMLAQMPADTIKVLAFVPVHIFQADGLEACKAQIAEIGQRHGAKVIDWRIPSAITREDSNYWDSLHYRVPIATRLARDLPAAALSGKDADDGTYRMLGR